MITKSAHEAFSKVSFFRGYNTLPSRVKLLYDKLKYIPGKALSGGKSLGGAAAKLVDKGVQGLEWWVDKAVKSPAKVIPATVAGGVAAKSVVDKSLASNAFIEDPDSGVTRVTPFLGKIKFTDQSYKKYYY